MRMLFTFVGGRGHLEPLLPVARAAAAAGHAVAFAASGRARAALEALGFEAILVGPAGSGRPRARLPLLPVDMEREERDLRERFARLATARRAPLVAALLRTWAPDAVVCDETDFGAMIAAERAGVPRATVQVLAVGSLLRPDVVGEPLAAARAEHGLRPDPKLAMLAGSLVLSPFPPTLRDPAHPLPACGHALHLVRPEPAGPPLRPLDAPGGPRVYFTLGTEFNTESGDLFARVLDGLAALPARTLATVGEEIDPAELGPQPDGVRVERFVPQAEVLPHVDLVVSHGGSGSVLGALAHGLPLVLLPLGADQPPNAARLEELGAAVVLDAVAATPAAVAAAVRRALAEPSYRDAARRLRDELEALPGPERAVELLERLR